MNEQKMNYEHVLSPIKIGPMTLKNRVSFTPVWPSFATADGHVNRELIEWVRDIVKGGAAVLISDVAASIEISLRLSLICCE